MAELYAMLEAALLECDPARKCAMTEALYRQHLAGELRACPEAAPVLAIDDPGRPDQPMQVDPRNLKRRSVATGQGRIVMLHAFAHIEFNAVNIALDAVYRFRDMPAEFIRDWLLVANEEAIHFGLLERSLVSRGSYYGEFPAHRGLWDMVCKTRHDSLHRMALVPRVMEARGLDVTPAMIERFEQVGDIDAVAILQRIYRDEIGHVRIGNHWYRFLCERRGLNPQATFQQLLRDYMNSPLRGPFNRSARLAAGFAESEMDALEQGA